MLHENGREDAVRDWCNCAREEPGRHDGADWGRQRGQAEERWTRHRAGKYTSNLDMMFKKKSLESNRRRFSSSLWSHDTRHRCLHSLLGGMAHAPRR